MAISVTLPPEVARKLEKLAEAERGNRSAAVARAVLAAPMSHPPVPVSNSEVEAFVRRSELTQYLTKVAATSGDPAAREAARELLQKMVPA